MEAIQSLFGQIKEFLSIPIFKIGATQVTLWTLLYTLVLLVLLFYFTSKMKRWIVDQLLAQSKVDIGVRQAGGTIAQYLVVVIGLMVILQTAGIDLTTLNVLAGAVGIGVGFGLQNIANNFISGLIILFERPIKIGDRVEVGGVEGDVIKIGARSTTVLTNDDIAIIIPNSKFVTENVVNWSHTGDQVRFKVPVSVAYGSDARLVEKLLLEVAKENRDVLDSPQPVVRFLEFGDSGLLFELRAWSSSLIHRKGKLISALNFAIYDKFAEHKIEIPFPQREVHIRRGRIEWKSSDKSGGESCR
jgi:small-conductance mechanosensitive channel